MALDWRRSPGWIFSAAAHGALLAGLIVALPDAKTYTDAQETVPVEVLTEQQFNEIVKGDKQAKKDLPDQRADKVAEVPESNPEPPQAEAKKNIPTPPPPARPQPDPGRDDAPKPATPAPKIAALPPPRPEREQETPAPAPVPLPPVRTPAPAKPAIVEPPKPVSEQAEIPMPPLRPKIEPKPEPKPEPKKLAAKTPAKPVAAEPEKPEPPVPLPPRRPRDIPRVVKAQPSPDRIAKLLEQRKREDAANARPRSGAEDEQPQRNFDRGAIARLLSKEAPENRGSAGQKLQQDARRGSPTANAAKMSPSMWGQLDGLMQEQYKRCWSYLGLATGRRYIPQIRVSYSPAGRLVSGPTLLNPPADPAMRSLAESAVRAVQKCDPLRIPPQFAPYHDQWKSRVLRFDPEEMMG